MKRIFLFFGFCAFAMLLNAQTADDIINSHIKTMGGLEKLNSIQTLHMIGIATAPNGSEVKTEIWKIHNQLFRRETNFGMGSMTQLITSEGAWSTNPRSGGNFEALPEVRRIAQLHEMDCQGPLINYAVKGHKVEFIGKETANGKESFKIKLTTKEGRELNYFLDASNYYINSISYKGGGGGMQRDPNAEIVINFSNYEKTSDGFIFAFSTSMSGGFGGNMIYEIIEVNTKIEKIKSEIE